MAKNKWPLVSLLSAVSMGSGLAAAQPGGAGRFARLDAKTDRVVTVAMFQTRALERFTRADARSTKG
jgi:hypothetical protein